MIKTVSFAPPRAVSGANSKPSSKVAARSAAVQNAKARVKTNASLAPIPTAIVGAASDTRTIVGASSMTSLFPKPSAPAEVSAAQAREQLQNGAPATNSRPRSTASASAPKSAKRSPRRVAPPELSLDLFSVDPAPVDLMPVVEAEAEAEAGVRLETKTKAELQLEVAAVENSVVQAVAPQAVAPQAVAPQAVAPTKRAKRAKVPVNLAEQYGQSLSKRVEGGVESPVAEEETPKKRLNRAERAARRELMNPDDDLRARLQRAQSVVLSAKTEKRPRGWRFNCGRCGRTSYFETPGALCSCGALAIKE